MAKSLNDRIAERTAELTRSVNYHREKTAEYEREIEALPEKLAERQEMIARLNRAGFATREGTWTDNVEVACTRPELVKVHAILGRLNGREVTKELIDPDKNTKTYTVKVSVPAANHPLFTVVYHVEVSRRAKKGQKCRVETIRYKARTEKRLVCNA